MLLWPFNKYPGTDYETFNWEWILKTVKEYTAKVDSFIEEMTSNWDTFRKFVLHEISEMHRKFAIYVNVTEEALNTGAIADGAITEEKINDGFAPYIENAYKTPEMFNITGTDSDKLEYAINNTPPGGVLCIGRTYTLDRNIVLSRTSSDERITIIGIGTNAEINCGNYCFTGTVEHNTGNILWKNISFKSNLGIFDSDYLIRMFFEGCVFDRTGSIMFTNIENDYRYCQTIYFIDCVIRRATDFLINMNGPGDDKARIIDTRFTNCIIEWCTSGITNAGRYSNVSITGCCIEGFNTNEPLFAGMYVIYTFNVEDNYFEQNNTIYFDFSQFDDPNPITFTFTHNQIQENPDTTLSLFKLGEKKGSNTSIVIVEGNTFRSNVEYANRCTIFDVTETIEKLTTWNVYNNCNVYNYMNVKNDPNNYLVVYANIDAMKTEFVENYGLINMEPGSSVTFTAFATGMGLTTSQMSIPVTFPFIAPDTDYTFTVNRILITGIADTDTSLIAMNGQKVASGMDLRYTDTTNSPFITYRPYNIRITLTVTF